MIVEDYLAITSMVALIVICIWFCMKRKRLMHFFEDLTEYKKGKAH